MSWSDFLPLLQKDLPCSILKPKIGSCRLNAGCYEGSYTGTDLRPVFFFPKTAFPNTLAIHWFQHRLLFFRHFFERFALAHLPRSYLIHLFGSSPDAQYQHLTTSAPQEGLQATPVKSLARGLPSSLIQPIDRNLSSRHTARKRK